MTQKIVCEYCHEVIGNNGWDNHSCPPGTTISPTVRTDTMSGWSQSLEAGGGVKYDGGKLRFDLIPTEAFEEVVWNYTMGASKYADDNWRKGMSFRRLFGAMMRHAWAWFRGEQRDPKDTQHHLAAVVFYALNLIQLELERPEFDDRWNPVEKKATGFMKNDWYVTDRKEL
jgi:hypothetical protein